MAGEYRVPDPVNYVPGPGEAVIWLRPYRLGYCTLVDAEDHERLSAWAWDAHVDKRRGLVYASRREVQDRPLGRRVRAKVYMHREVVGAVGRVVVDHRVGYGLDNRRANLRVTTYSGNALNVDKEPGESGFIGVTRSSSRSRPWRARASFEGEREELGSYRCRACAAIAYDLRMIRGLGDHAWTNMLRGAPRPRPREEVRDDEIPF